MRSADSALRAVATPLLRWSYWPASILWKETPSVLVKPKIEELTLSFPRIPRRSPEGPVFPTALLFLRKPGDGRSAGCTSPTSSL
ncbi:hypothetical protein I79_019005 [Cricetulus griseus]|uniref:Uncharacterized protein n=1 Tax=Cricetulus griseus TaxID=10029 RepID=G3I693_CRIGR|nr:hypothetical protein I79_019005 [Cricetulus griseus]ERE83810.1 hypothetical protein H671_2g6442 [Cricetulus griseus]